jgi:hypothetical protein
LVNELPVTPPFSRVGFQVNLNRMLHGFAGGHFKTAIVLGALNAAIDDRAKIDTLISDLQTAASLIMMATIG